MKAPLNRSVTALGTGSCIPPRVITNPILRDLCTNYDEGASGDFSTWVDRVTHIKERRYIADGQTAGHLGAEAAKNALDMAGVKPTELDLIIHASFTPSACVPGDHVMIADLIGAKATPSFTLTAACAGSMQAMAMAYGMLASGVMKRILVTGSETISPTLNYSDPLTSILFGDGAGAVVLGAVGDSGSDAGMLAPQLGFEFNWENISMGNMNMPFTSKVANPASNGSPATVEKTFLEMTGGPSVLRNAVNTMADMVRKVLGYTDGKVPADEMEEIRARLRLVPHQANGRIVDGIAKKLGMPADRVTKTVHKYGNVSAASNLMALDYAMRHGNYKAEVDPDTGKILEIHATNNPIQRGDLVVLPSIGAGYLFGAVGFVNGI